MTTEVAYRLQPEWEKKGYMRYVFLMLVPLILVACGPQKKGLFSDKRSEHEKYADRIREAGLDKTTMGALWFSAAERGLVQPLGITLPYKESGYFAADKPASAGYRFPARRGQRLTLSIAVVPDTLRDFFGELWITGETKGDQKLVASIDSTRHIVHDVEEDGNYVVRVQPPLLEAVEYTVTINTGPSLAFPVSETGKPQMISFWSDPRDGGKRSHQGVDISATFRTPAIASADGIVHRVMENRLGGKVIFMRPKDKPYSLYYAHLDSQVVSSGTEVKAGQVLGLVGTTGNAQGTVPHLHFGIYGRGGAIDPLPFIDPRTREPAPITAPTNSMGEWMRTTSETPLFLTTSDKDTSIQLERGTAVFVFGAAGRSLKVMLPDGTQGFLANRNITSNILKQANYNSGERLLDRPQAGAPAVTTIDGNSQADILGTFGAFELVRYGDDIGWVQRPALSAMK